MLVVLDFGFGDGAEIVAGVVGVTVWIMLGCGG